MLLYYVPCTNTLTKLSKIQNQMVLWSRTVVSFLVLMTPVETPLLLPPLASSGIDNMPSASDKEYEVSTTRGRHFSGTVGLRSGYEKGGMEFNRSDLLEAFTSWMKERHRNKEKFVGAIFGVTQDISYGFVDPQNETTLQTYVEPVVEVRGEIASYQEGMTDEEILETLRSLFVSLGSCTQQTTVRFTYWGDNGYRESFRIRLPNMHHPLDKKNDTP